MSDLAVNITNLHKVYKEGVVALKGINLQVPKGQFFGLLGPNGAGKTTTIGITTGLIRPTSGSVTVMGHDVVADYRQARSAIGLAAQELNFDWFFNLETLMQQQAGYYGVPANVAKPRAARLLEEFGLGEKKKVKPRELSGGMKRRFQIARSLIHDPDILILDEPTAGVDVELRHMLWDYLTRLNGDGKTIILTTHYIEEAEKLCEQIAIIDNGKIVTEGTPQELVAGMNSDGLVIEVDGHGPEAEASLNRYSVTRSDNELTISTQQPELQIAEVANRVTAAGAMLKDVKIRRTTLEDVFMQLTGRSIDE